MFSTFVQPDLWSPLPERLGWHAVLVVLSVGLGVGIAVPVGVLASGRRWWRGGVLGVAGVLQTIPGLALLSLVFVALIALSGWIQAAWGLDERPFAALGFWPSLITLTLYSLLPILRNTVTGIEGVDPAPVEAARGCGMTRWQRLTRVELPLAMPTILAGVRTATVWTVGIATLAALIGQPCLGSYITQGLATSNTRLIVFGCIWSAALAIVLDALLGLLEAGLRRRDKRRVWAAGITLSFVLAAAAAPALPSLLRGGASGFDAIQANATQPADPTPQAPRDRREVRIAAKPFTESLLLAHLLAGVVGDEFPVRVIPDLGGPAAYEALRTGEIDMYVDYSGTVWATLMHRPTQTDRDLVLREMTRWLRETDGVVSLGSLGFENAYVVAVRRADADRLNLQTIGDLAPYAPRLRVAGDLEFFSRAEWKGVRGSYGLAFENEISMHESNMYTAQARGEVDVVIAYTASPQIEVNDLVLLADPQHALPPYDAVLLLSPQAAARPELVAKLRPLIGSIPVEAMRRANYQADIEGRPVEEVAKGLKKGAEGLRGLGAE